jgi:pilus assembly protein Flp/PilA
MATQLRRHKPKDYQGETMSNSLLKLYVKLQGLKYGEEGQDLVEYALLVALIALVCITGVNNVATAVNTVFTNISNSLG